MLGEDFVQVALTGLVAAGENILMQPSQQLFAPLHRSLDPFQFTLELLGIGFDGLKVLGPLCGIHNAAGQQRGVGKRCGTQTAVLRLLGNPRLLVVQRHRGIEAV